MSSSTKKPLDLQIFLGRAPGRISTNYPGIPSLFGGGRSQSARNHTRNIAPDRSSEHNTERDLRSIPDYLAIANSEAIEGIDLEIPVEQAISLSESLAMNDLRWLDCVEFGNRLFDFIFHRSIRDLFRSLRMNQIEKQGLRLTIATQVPELMFLPWELMCDTRPGMLPDFLCYHPRIHLCRSLRIFNRAEFAETPLGLNDEKLRILLVTASPGSLSPIDVRTEERMLRFVLSEYPGLDNVELQIISNADVNSLRDRLFLFRPHIVHVACHGGFDSENSLGFIVLSRPGDSERHDLVHAFRFATILSEVGGIQLVFLNACHGAAPGTISAFSGVAQCIHAVGVPAVVALQFLLLDKTAHAIVLNFYKSLLRDQCTVEESVTRVRRYLFLNDYHYRECFGLSLFQSNRSLQWPHGLPTERVTAPEALVKKFEENQQLKIQEHLASIPNTGVPESVLLRFINLSTKLCQTQHENKPIATAFLFCSEESPDEYRKQHQEEIAEDLDNDFFDSNIRKIISKAITVNGVDRAFIIVTRKNEKKPVDQFIGKLAPVGSNTTTLDFSLGDTRWLKIWHATRDLGCALIVQGNNRVKLLVRGELVSEYRHGEWKHVGIERFRDILQKLSVQHNFNTVLLTNIFNKCLMASDIHRGVTFIVQRKIDLLQPKHCQRCEPISEASKDLFGKKVSEFSSQEYLDRVMGDNAIILNSEGITLAVHAAMATDPTTQVISIPGTGSRHLSAQKVTKETDALAFVVSEDGPITVFLDGEVVFRVGE